MIQIAVDGPSGAGKSTLAKGIARELGIIYVDTGALYRTIGLYVKENGVDPHDARAVESLLPNIKIELKYEEGRQCVYLNGVNPGDKIRTPEMSMYASAVSAIPAVRAFLLETQRSIARSNSVVMDGRDIGTVILPNATVKIFLTATPEDRAKRRYEELLAKGISVTYDEVLRDIVERDKNDSGREIAPAVPAEDAIILDNSGFTNEMTLKAALKIISNKLMCVVDCN